MSVRRLYLDISPGEVRGVATLDGLAERLFIERSGVDLGPGLDARYRARVAEIAGDLKLARLDLGQGLLGVLPLKPGAGLARGATVEVETAAEARGDKAAVFRLIGAGDGKPGLLSPAPGLDVRLQAAALGVGIVRGAAAREAADAAEDAVLAVQHALPGGVSLSIEPTRALTAVDVDRAASAGASAKTVMDANRTAIGHAARLLRLKGLGGAIVIDLIGFPRDGGALQAAARVAFAPDEPGVAVLPVSRLGLLQVSRPHRERPLAERLCDLDGPLSARSIAQRLARALEREGRADPGARLVARCAPETAAPLRPLVAELGPRFSVEEALGWERSKTDIQSR